MPRFTGITRRRTLTITSIPPIPVTWGEQSKDEMGSVSLIAVPKVQADYVALQADLQARTREAARERIRQDPSFMIKLQALIAQ